MISVLFLESLRPCLQCLIQSSKLKWNCNFNSVNILLHGFFYLFLFKECFCAWCFQAYILSISALLWFWTVKLFYACSICFSSCFSLFIVPAVMMHLCTEYTSGLYWKRDRDRQTEQKINLIYVCWYFLCVQLYHVSMWQQIICSYFLICIKKIK